MKHVFILLILLSNYSMANTGFPGEEFSINFDISKTAEGQCPGVSELDIQNRTFQKAHQLCTPNIAKLKSVTLERDYCEGPLPRSYNLYLSSLKGKANYECIGW